MNSDESKLAKTWIKTRYPSGECFVPGCCSATSDNHLLQKNGILSELSKDGGKVYQLLTDRFKEDYYSFTSKGLNKAFVFNSLCSSCDDKLFKSIEKTGTNKVPETEIEFCAYAIRAFLNEASKKKGNIQYFQSQEYKDVYDPTRESLESKILSELLGIEVLERLALLATQVVMGEKTNLFEFKVREIPRTDLCACSVFFLPRGVFIEQYDVELIGLKVDCLTDQYIKQYNKNVLISFPVKNSSVLVCGHYVKSHTDSTCLTELISTLPVERLGKFFTKILVESIEDWIVSKKFYEEKGKSLESFISYSKRSSTRMRGLNHQRYVKNITGHQVADIQSAIVKEYSNFIEDCGKNYQLNFFSEQGVD